MPEPSAQGGGWVITCQQSVTADLKNFVNIEQLSNFDTERGLRSAIYFGFRIKIEQNNAILREIAPSWDDLTVVQSSAMSSAQSSGRSWIKRCISAMQSGSSATITSTPRSRRKSSLPPKVVFSARVHDATCGEGRKGFELKILNKKDLRYARFPPRPSDDHAKPAFRSGQDTIGDPRNHAGRSRKWPNR